jgi:hypothetical protein
MTREPHGGRQTLASAVRLSESGGDAEACRADGRVADVGEE